MGMRSTSRDGGSRGVRGTGGAAGVARHQAYLPPQPWVPVACFPPRADLLGAAQRSPGPCQGHWCGAAATGPAGRWGQRPRERRQAGRALCARVGVCLHVRVRAGEYVGVQGPDPAVAPCCSPRSSPLGIILCHLQIWPPRCSPLVQVIAKLSSPGPHADPQQPPVYVFPS